MVRIVRIPPLLSGGGGVEVVLEGVLEDLVWCDRV
jgi:hypothetical protein